MQQWCRVAAFGGELKRNAGIVICCWEYSEILGACKTGAWKSITTRYILMVNPEVEAGPTLTKTRNEEMMSEFGATMGCKGCLVIGQPHTECRARITTRMENDPAHAKRLKDNLTRRSEFANPEPEDAAPTEGRTDATKRARQVEVGPPRESANTGGAARSSAGADVDMRSMNAGKRPLEPGGDVDMVCGLDVCDELHEYSSDSFVNDREGDYTDEVTGVTLLRDDVAKARAEEMAWYEKFSAYEEVTDANMFVKNGTKTHLLSMERHQQK